MIEPNESGILKWITQTSRYRVIQIVLQIIMIFLTIVLVLVATRSIVPSIIEIEQNVEGLAEMPPLQIMYPENGANVLIRDHVIARSDYTDMLHYIVVTPSQTGVTYVEGRNNALSARGVLMGRAVYGDAASCGQAFAIRVVATDTELSPGPLADFPPQGAEISDPVIVHRYPC